MKVTDKTLEESETSVTLDLFEGKRLTAEQKDQIRQQVGEYLVEQTSIRMSQETSPVSGGQWKKQLTPAYAKIKKAEVGNTKANLEATGEMLDELKFEPTDEGIKIGIFGERAPAADGHNNLSGKSALPERRFLPDEGQSYKSDIKREVDRIVADVVAETTTFKKSDFAGVESKGGLYSALAEIFGPLSRAELKLAVFRNSDLVDLLLEMDLLDLL